MVYGFPSISGNVGNLKSVTCRLYKAVGGSNPTLTARSQKVLQHRRLGFFVGVAKLESRNCSKSSRNIIRNSPFCQVASCVMSSISFRCPEAGCPRKSPHALLVSFMRSRASLGGASWCAPRKQGLSSSCLLHQAILVMQAAKQSPLQYAVTGGRLVPMVTGRNTLLVGFRNFRS